MLQPSHCIGAALACALVVGTASAQTQGDEAVPPGVASRQASEIAKGDPARWYRADDTPQARLRTLRKEIGAAYEQAKAACRQEPAPSRAACLKQARDGWQYDMAHAREQLDAAPGQSDTSR